MCASIRVERELGKTCEVGESLLEVVVYLKRTLNSLGVLQGVNLVELGHGGDFLVDFRVVLHGTAAEGVETGVNAEVLGRQIGIVTHHVEFAHLGEV